jgi:hypothetical protein
MTDSITEPVPDVPGETPKAGFRSVDEFIDQAYPTQSLAEAYAAWVLLYFRQSAVNRWKFASFMREHLLFCTYCGKRYRVTGASRLGDIWLAEDFTRETGYDLRVCVDNCCDWSPKP